MLTDIYDIQAYAETLTKHAKTKDGKSFNVRYDSKAKGPYTIERPRSIDIVLPTLNSHMTERDGVLARWFMIHEIAHHTEGAEMYDIAVENALTRPDEDPLAAAVNIFEDGRIERLDGQKYVGDAKIFSKSWDIVLEEQIARLKKQGGFPEDEELQRIASLVALEMEARSNWNGGAASNYHEYQELLPQKSKDYLKLLKDNGFIDVLRNADTAKEVFEAAKKAYELIWEKSADEHIEEQKQKQKQEGDGEEEEDGDESGTGEESGTGGSSSKGNKKDSKRGQEGKGTGKGDPIKELKESKEKVNYLDLLANKHAINNFRGASASGITLDYSEYIDRTKDYKTYTPTKWKDIHVAWWHKDKFSHSGMRNEAHHSSAPRHIKQKMANIHSTHGVPGKGFGNKVRKHLQVLSQAHYVGGHKSGRLHRKNAYKIGVKKVGDGTWNSQIFKRKHQSNILDVAVCVLTDISGSMMGSKVVHAIDSAMLLNTSIGTSLHVPLQLLTFTEDSSDLFIGVVKDYDERLSDSEIRDNMLKSCSFMSSNPDGDAVSWAYRYLKPRKEKRKILVVLSDGSPASSRPGDDMAYVQRVVSEIEKEGIVEIIGIGIKDRNVELIYSNNETIKHASDLEKAVLNVIKRKIIK